MTGRAARQGGFTLLEVLVAFVIVAMVLGVAMPLLGQGLRGVAAAERRSLALLHAESRLAALIAEAPSLRARAQNGELPGGFRWEATAAPLAGAIRAGRADIPAEAVLYRVAVSWAGARAEEEVTLSTVRLVPLEERR